MPHLTNLPWRRGYRLEKYIALMTCFLLLAVLQPHLEDTELGRRLSQVLIGSMFVTSVWAVGRRPRLMLLGILLAVPGLLLTGLLHDVESDLPAVIAQSILMVLLGTTIVVILVDVLSDSPVTRDTICGAIVAYLLLGLAWALFYSTLVQLDPEGSFEMPLDSLPDRTQYSMFIYHSFVTLTTLGYGDMVPLSTQARTLCWLEAVMGQLYLVTLVARLVGRHATTMPPIDVHVVPPVGKSNE